LLDSSVNVMACGATAHSAKLSANIADAKWLDRRRRSTPGNLRD
jgi:hypothetical protein